MLRMIMAILAFAQIVSANDSTRVRVYYPPANLSASDYSRMKSAEAPKSTLSRTQSEYLVLAGQHWLVSIGLGLAGTGVLWLNDFHAGLPGGGFPAFAAAGMILGAVGFQLAVPIDLILAGKASK